jgi:hypothetical protein
MGKSSTTCRSQLLFKLQHEYLHEYFQNIETLFMFKPSKSCFRVRMVFIVGSGAAKFGVVVRPPWAAESKFRHNEYFK